ncbi:MAG: FapA family protein [Thiovulaceae bacterium]|nr:FapA family protein [Sulfurimonadaceae bacterium]
MSEVQAVITTTTNIKDALQSFMNINKLSLEQTYFDIISYTNFYRIIPSKQWVKIDPKIRKKVLSPKNLTNSHLKFVEQYKVRIYHKPKPKPFQAYVALQTNKHKTKVIIVIKKGLSFSDTNATLDELIQEIQRKLTYSGFYLGLFSSDIEKSLQPFLELLKTQKNLLEDQTITISQGIKPVDSIQSKIISHFLLKGDDFRRAYESGVDAGELIVEYHFPVVGNAGRSCQGKYLEPQGTPIVSCQLLFPDSSTIQAQVHNDKISYFAKKKGFVYFEDQELSISNELSLDIASLKTTGSITLGGHRNIDLKIDQEDKSKDALNRGIAVDVSSVDIKGSIADNTSIKAEDVSINAHTHKSSTIEAANDASVHLHRGNLKAKNATIGKLEFGLIEADIVHVNEVLGGEIRAREIYIDLLHSNAKLIASDIIQVKQIRGKHNSFIIAPDRIDSLGDYITEIREQAKKTERSLKLLQRDYDRLITKIETTYGSINTVQKEVALAVRQGKQQPVLAATMVRQHGIDTQKSLELESQIQQTQSDLENYHNIIQAHQHSMQNAKIQFKDYWNGSQEIFYEYSDSKRIEKVIPEGFKPEIVYKDLNESDLIVVSN